MNDRTTGMFFLVISERMALELPSEQGDTLCQRSRVNDLFQTAAVALGKQISACHPIFAVLGILVFVLLYLILRF